MAYPIFSKIDKNIYNSIVFPGNNNNLYNDVVQEQATALSCWVRIISGTKIAGETGIGLILQSNPKVENVFDDYLTYDSAGKPQSVLGKPSIYGGTKSSGMLGIDWSGAPVYPSFTTEHGEFVLKPGPLVQTLEIKEGKDQISRHCIISIKCFTLGQAEKLQQYLMEPGHTLLIEFGWNNPSALNELIKTDSNSTIIQQATDLLEYNALMKKRKSSNGNYDAFYGFITGGSLTSEGDKFIINIKLRGAPGLPAFLQGQHNILPLNSVTKQVETVPSTQTYSVLDISAESKGTETTSVAMGGRRYKWMFNKLPGNRQTDEVQKIVNKVYEKGTVYGSWDLLNFDYKIQRDVADWAAGQGGSFFSSLYGEKEVNVGGLSVPREKLVSKNKYIQFGLVLDILNANNGLYGYVLGNKEVKCRISTNGYIGAFPGIFSTKPSKLVIPGYIPDFYKFFVSANSTVSIEDMLKTPFIDNSIAGRALVQLADGSEVYAPHKISFVQSSDLPPKEYLENLSKNKQTYTGFYEKGEYYGRLEFLYLNFEVFLNVLKNSSNKSIKDILVELCNEMSSAVNSFWNLQVIETPYDNEVVLSIIDENWRGYLKDKNTNVRNFIHSGEQSVFLEASLDIDIPSEMTNQIVLKRENYSSNPDSKGLDMGGLFGQSKDVFFTEVDYRKTSRLTKNTEANKNAPTKSASQLKAEWQAEVNALKAENITIAGRDTGPAARTQYTDASGNLVFYEEVSRQGRIVNTYSQTNPIAQKLKRLDEQQKTAEEAEKKILEAAVNSSLEKIDIIPNPERNIIVPKTLEPANAGPDGVSFKENFRIYCCDDTQLFDVLKNNAFEKYSGIEKTSHPLPIKYTFKILGKSGIRRGDTFNIIGIPKKYADYGFFQVIDIEQNLEGNKWETTVTGQYFQQFNPNSK